MHRERDRLREAVARTPALVRRSEVFGALARACRAELERRGWVEDDAVRRVTGTGAPIEPGRAA